MHIFTLKTASAAIAGAAVVLAHGHAIGINVAGAWYEGYDPIVFPFKSNLPTVVGWTGFITSTVYSSEDIICHTNSSVAGGYAAVQAGDEMEVFWTAWPESHKGPNYRYVANCNGDCTSPGKTELKFFKIGAIGRMDDTAMPGKWATDILIANNHSWVIKIPSDLYEGTLAHTGTVSEGLYSDSEPGILVNIYETLSSYDIPGPTEKAAGTNLAQSELGITAAIKTGVPNPSSGKFETTTVADVTSAPATSSTILSASSVAE
ncbi:hypothetical protein N0V82_002193 [Gnomoniopsis sp. IMI 355080]|nr:hypothetical protein N0V82_002193 [Gnomoniopsis sp. IMI 355080]